MTSAGFRPWVGIAGAAVVAAVALFLIRGGSASSDAGVIRDSLRALRATADSCLARVGRESAALDAYRSRLDSLRGAVRGLEDDELGGVPADSYATYLEAFHRYNDSVAAWTGHADTLRARDRRCRAIAEAHNRIADSLSRAMHEGT